MRDEPWSPLAELLEEFEYFPRRPDAAHSLKVAAGLLLAAAGVVLLAVNEVRPESFDRWLPEIATLPLAAVAVVAGAVYAHRSLPRHLFARLQRWVARRIWVVATLVQVVLAAVSAFLALALILLQAAGEAEVEDLVAFGGVIAAACVLSFAIGGAQLQVGVVALRSRLRAGATSRWLDTVSLAALFAVPVVLVSRTELDWAAAAVPAVLALIGSHFQRASAFDRTVQDLMRSYESVRREGLAAASGDPCAPLHAAFREMHIDLAQRPRVLGSPVRSASFEALCAVADARSTGRGSPVWSSPGSERSRAAHRVWAMPERDFALGAAQVADAQLQQIDPSLAPPGVRVPQDLRAILGASALPRPAGRRTVGAPSDVGRRSVRRRARSRARDTRAPRPAGDADRGARGLRGGDRRRAAGS